MDKIEPKVETEELVFGTEGVVKEIQEAKPTIQLQLVGDGHPFLKTKIEDYDFTKEDNTTRADLVVSMLSLMRQFGGIGLSANQVGINRRVFVMDQIIEKIDEKTGQKTYERGLHPMFCFNPVIIRELAPAKPHREACLSFPGLSLSIARAEEIEVRYENELGDLVEVELKGLEAACFQHELDHLNGIVFTEKIKQQGLLSWEREKQRKLLKRMTKQYEAFTKLKAQEAREAKKEENLKHARKVLGYVEAPEKRQKLNVISD